MLKDDKRRFTTHQNRQTGMRSESWHENKKKPLKDQNFQGFWWSNASHIRT